MAPSFLRKRGRPQSNSNSPDTHKVVRPSLSLPDLTTPLLDISSWEEVAPFKFEAKSPISPFSPTSPTSPTSVSRNGGRKMSFGKKPSLITSPQQNTFPQFHRPFTPKLINHKDLNINFDDSNSPNGNKEDFRKSRIGWSSDHPFSQPIYNYTQPQPPSSWKNQQYTRTPQSASASASASGHGEGGSSRDSLHRVISRRKGRKKGTVGKLNIAVVGGKGVGKTGFINLLLSSLNTPEHPTPIMPLRATSKLSSYTAISTIDERLLVRIIDTPGLDLRMNDEFATKSRMRGVGGLIRLLEDRFEVMCEEEKKIRRMTGGEEGLIHLVIYLIDAREILRPQARGDMDIVDWSCIGLFDDDQPSFRSVMDDEAYDPSSEARVSEVEIEIIRKLSKRANVLPILTHSDLLTISELNKVKAVMRRDLGNKKYDIPGKGFGIFNDVDDTSTIRKSIDSERGKGEDDQRPPTPDSITANTTNIANTQDIALELPYHIFLPDQTIALPQTTEVITTTKTTGSSIITTTTTTSRISAPASDSDGADNSSKRVFKWGRADIFNSAHNDFNLLKDNILGENSKILINSTRETLYEAYRTERLLTAKRQTRITT
ncbi:uncharacterized protein I303_103399 [Kwoniella dejecticola CBS 10117]|uniref:Septin-type G domain-containing protein n=1 Tax=Kwoniella dejecticola CBS 10117 TaxID=1296121 RepID=A0A1A6A6M4_9TREE|nr:uncharacterized protein I303_03422 [Kwoniella dejecticola CBS 10117]OBR85711.1 hypothetical protein I303_03422 [Kwoniella dejecticola CBS 10117]